MRGAEVEVRVAVDTPAALGEGPAWLAGTAGDPGALCWVDIPARRLHRFVPATGARRHWEFDADLGSVAPTDDGAYLLALRDGLWRFEPDPGDADPRSGRRARLVDAPYEQATRRFNDGKCDPRGRFWVGSMDEPRRPAHAALYCYDGRDLVERQDGITISNGLAWSPDATTMYWTDTTQHVVWAFDFDAATGAMSGRRVFARFPLKGASGLEGYGGRPDGAAVDAEGCYWVAMYEGGRVLRLSPAGERLREVRVPALCPTMPCFGGDDLKTVYVTSARINRDAAELHRLPDSGCVFAFDVDVPGLATEVFRPSR
jgi:sugar lactone lactonase YvrE